MGPSGSGRLYTGPGGAGGGYTAGVQGRIQKEGVKPCLPSAKAQHTLFCSPRQAGD